MGGNAGFKGFRDRVEKDVRKLISDDYELNVECDAKKYVDYAWHGGKLLANNTDFNDLVVTKKSYDEFGHNLCKKKFDILH